MPTNIRRKSKREFEVLNQKDSSAEFRQLIQSSSNSSNLIVYIVYALVLACTVTGLTFSAVGIADMRNAQSNITTLQSTTITATEALQNISNAISSTAAATVSSLQSQLTAQNVQVGSLTNRVTSLETSHNLFRFTGTTACDLSTGLTQGTALNLAVGSTQWGAFTSTAASLVDFNIPEHIGYGSGSVINLVSNGTTDIYTIRYGMFCRGPTSAVPLTPNSYSLKLFVSNSTSLGVSTGTVVSLAISPWVLETTNVYSTSAMGLYTQSMSSGTSVGIVHSQIGGPSSTNLVCVLNLDIKKNFD
jgi:cell division protein FtsB